MGVVREVYMTTYSDTEREGGRGVGAAINMFLFALCLKTFADTVADPDLWGHLRFGRDILAAQAITQVDPYSFMTGGVQWVNHEWLSEAVFALIYSIGGASGLILLKIVIGMGVVALLRREMIHYGIPSVRALILLLPVIWVLPMHLGAVRPHWFTLVGFAVTVWAICRREEGTPWILWVLPPVFALWANLHGGFLAGAGIVLLWLTTRLIMSLRQTAGSNIFFTFLKEDVFPVGVSLLATLANPYGVGLWAFLLRTAIVPRPEITEWAPLRIISIDGMAYLVVLVLTGGTLLASRRPKRPTLVFIYFCLALLPMVALRHLPLFVVGAISISVPYFADGWERWFGPYRPRRERVFLALSIALSAFLVSTSVPHLREISVKPSFCPVPARAVAMLSATRGQARLAVDFNWGEYTIWHVGPRILVSVDGRRETVYTEAIYKENLAFHFGCGKWDSLFDKRGADLALVKRDSPAYNLLRLRPGWSLVYEDLTCGLFALDDSTVGAELRGLTPPDLPHDGAGLTFP